MAQMRKIVQLENYLRCKGVFASHEFTIWGAANFYNEPNRLKHKLIERGIIKKLTFVQLRGIGKENSKEDWYVYIGGKPIINNRAKYALIGVEI